MVKKGKNFNFLEYIPIICDNINYFVDSQNEVIIKVENTGFFNKIMQKLLGKPRFSQIHLGKIGSFVFLLIDNKKNIYTISNEVISVFGDTANYKNTCRYINMLSKCGFVKLKMPNEGM